MVSINGFELHNIVKKNGGYQVRDALFSHATIDNAIWGTSLEAANTGEVFHYILTRNTSTGIGTITVYTEEFVTVTSLAIGVIVADCTVTCAVSDRQLLINSPQFSYPIYGLVGGGLRRAVKKVSENDATTAIDVPNGLVIEFGGRFVIAQSNILWFSDPGATAKETFVAQNFVALNSRIFDLFIGADGALVAGTSDGVFSIPADSVAQGQLAFPLVQKLSHYQCRNYRNLVYSQGRLIGLAENGIVDLGNITNPLPLVTYNNARYYSKDVRQTDDFRTGRIFASQDMGALVCLDSYFCAVDTAQTLFPAWITCASATLDIKGILKTAEGKDLFLTSSKVLELYGNTEFSSQDVTAVACGDVALDPAQSTLIRAIHTSSDNVGTVQLCYIGGRATSLATPKPSRAHNVVGTDNWGTTYYYCEDELRSRRHDQSYRTDQCQLEIGIGRAAARIGEFTVYTKPVSPYRPTN